MIGAGSGKRRAAVIGGGVIGGGWAARFLTNGWDVCVYDPNPNTKNDIAEILDNARKTVPALADVAMPPEGRLEFAETIAEAATGANWIQESIPEVLQLKHEVLGKIQEHADEDAIVGSSTSGFKPSELQAGSHRPDQIVVTHPFNPVYLLPLVEVVASSASSESFVQQVCDHLTSVGMKPLRVRKEIDAHIADRLLESMWREALWLVNDDIATTGEIDDAIRFGFGLRWSQMGMFETYRLAGGEEGMAHFIRQFGPALQWPWSKLTNVPKMTEELVAKIADQSDAQSGAYSLRQLEGIRDRNLVGILRSLKQRDWGAGAVLNNYDKHLSSIALDESDKGDTAANGALHLWSGFVLPGWIDYNGHMTEFRYTQVFSDSCEALLKLVDMHAEYGAAGFSYYTAETHTGFVDEAGVNEAIYVTAQILFANPKSAHVFYSLFARDDERLLATCEAMYLHVDMNTGRVCSAEPAACNKLLKLADAHSAFPKPDSAGRFVGQRNEG